MEKQLKLIMKILKRKNENSGNPFLTQNEVRADIVSDSLEVFIFERGSFRFFSAPVVRFFSLLLLLQANEITKKVTEFFVIFS